MIEDEKLWTRQKNYQRGWIGMKENKIGEKGETYMKEDDNDERE